MGSVAAATNPKKESARGSVTTTVDVLPFLFRNKTTRESPNVQQNRVVERSNAGSESNISPDACQVGLALPDEAWRIGSPAKCNLHHVSPELMLKLS